MARSRKSREKEWPGTIRGSRTQAPKWANDGLGEPLPRAGQGTSDWSVRDLLLAKAMQRALEAQSEAQLRWVLKLVADHEVDRIRFGRRGFMLQDIEKHSPATADAALRLLGLTAPDRYGQDRLRRWVVDLALARHPGRRRQHMGLGRVIEGDWDGPMPRKVSWDE
ncbi:MAG: hypothetical protein AB7F98_04955 [Novosphingobium sp.]